ncbi:Zinc finger, C2H2 domain containing protein, partial [Parasponia andersonii]
ISRPSPRALKGHVPISPFGSIARAQQVRTGQIEDGTGGERRRLKMDRDWGSKPGSGGAASAQNEAVDRRERLRRLALETIDLAKDPYFMRNHLGSYECKLCLTLHNNEGNYLAHTQGKRHQTNLAKRAAREAKDAPAQPQPHKRKVNIRKTVKIGRPGYRVTKQFDPETKQRSLLFQLNILRLKTLQSRGTDLCRLMSRRVQPFDKRYQYLLFAAEPYEIIAFKVPSTEIDKSTPKFFSHWDPDSKMFTLQLYFKTKPPEGNKLPPASAANGIGAPGVPPRPLPPPPQAPPPPPPQGLAPGAQIGNPPRAPPPGIPGSLPPPPPPMVNGPQPMPPGGAPPAPPPPPVGNTMTNFGFGGQQIPGQGIHPPPPPPNMG